MYLIEEKENDRFVSIVKDIEEAIKKVQQGIIIRDTFNKVYNSYLEAGLYTIVSIEENCIYIINVEPSYILSYFDTKTILKKYTFAKRDLVVNSIFKFKKWLLQFYNYNNLNITEEELELVKTSIKREIYTSYYVRKTLREINLEKYIDHSYFIALILKNPNVCKLSEQDMNNIIEKYIEFINIYDDTFLDLGYFYILHKICQSIKLDNFIKSYPYPTKMYSDKIKCDKIWNKLKVIKS